MNDFQSYPVRNEGEISLKPDYFQRLLDQESVPVPDYLRLQSNPDMGTEDLDFSRYLSREFADLERKKLWPKVWQMVGREDELAQPGDHLVYNICDDSVIVTRGEDGQIRGFINACLHRGRALRDEGGRVAEFRCPFHGFTWALDGSFKRQPVEWDFKHICKDHMSLPQVKVGTWAGFVFINFDADCVPLMDYLGVLPEHYARYPLEKFYTGIHVQRRLDCNWKVGHEAFVESWHTLATHPHILPFTGDIYSQYDCFGDNISRSITPMGMPSPYAEGIPEQAVMESIMESSGRMAADNAEGMTLPEGQTARVYVAEFNRREFEKVSGQDLSGATLAELEDAILYSAFPNFQVWAGYHGNIVYQVRPDPKSHEHCIFEVRLLFRYPEGSPRPESVPAHVLGDDEPFASAPELGALGVVFDQDANNVAAVMRGMKTSRHGKARLAEYQESRIRHLHRTLDKYLAG